MTFKILRILAPVERLIYIYPLNGNKLINDQGNRDRLTRVRPLMSLQVRALGVHLLATRKLAFVYPALRVRWTVLVAPRMVPVSHGTRSCSGSCMCVLRACDRLVAIRCDGDQSAKGRNRVNLFPSRN